MSRSSSRSATKCDRGIYVTITVSAHLTVIVPFQSAKVLIGGTSFDSLLVMATLAFPVPRPVGVFGDSI